MFSCVLVESSLVLGCFPHTFLNFFPFEDPLVQGPVHLRDVGVEFLSPLDLAFLLPAIVTVLCFWAELYLIVLLDHNLRLLVPQIKLIDLDPSWIVEIKAVVSERIDRNLCCCLPCVRSLCPWIRIIIFFFLNRVGYIEPLHNMRNNRILILTLLARLLLCGSLGAEFGKQKETTLLGINRGVGLFGGLGLEVRGI